MRLIIPMILLSIALFTPSMAWEIRGNIYPANDGIIQWNPYNFAGFNLRGLESLQFNISEERLEAGAAEYQTNTQNLPFRHKAWGSYSELCFLGHEYFTGYSEGCQIAKPWSLFAQEERLGTILIDSDDSYTLVTEEPLLLKEGYSLKLSDANNGVKVSLYKENNLVDSQILQPPEDYIYEGAIANQTTPLIAAAIKANVKLEPKSYYTVKGLFQISEETEPLELGMEYGEMKVNSIRENGVSLINPVVMSLSKGQDFELMDGFRIKTSNINASSDWLYIYRNATPSDILEIRSEIAKGDISWTPQSFAGFCYDMDDDLGTETITTTLYDKKLEEPNGVLYTTTAQQKDFEFKEWGHYNKIVFLGESYVASYGEDSLLSHSSEWPSLLSFEKLGRVLTDSNKAVAIEDGSNLTLQEGLEAEFYIDKSCNKILIELYSKGELIDRDYFGLPNTYIYKKELAEAGEIAVLAIHITDADCAPNKNCLIDGIFQMSEDLVDVGVDLSFGNMRIASITTDTITMDIKDNTIILSDKMDIALTGNYHMKTVDRGTLEYYIYMPAPTKYDFT